MITLDLESWRPTLSEKRSLTLSDFPWLKSITDPPMTAGVTVNQESALSVAAYWNGIMMIAQSIGAADRFLYRKVTEDDRERAVGHPGYKVVHDQPNPHMTPQVFWETITAHAVGWGNGFAEIEWDAGNRPKALWPITPDKISAKVDTQRDSTGRQRSTVFYEYQGQQRIDAADIIHIPGLGYDGICGYSPVNLARRSLSLTIAAEEFGAAYFGNGSWTGAVLEHPAKLSDQAYERIKTQREQYRGPQKAHRLEILEEGMKLSRPLTIPPDDAQFLETRMFQIEEIARWLNLPSWKLKIQQAARPGGNPEISQIDFLTDTLLPWVTRIEQELNRKLIPQGQRGTFYYEHLFEKLLRADVTTRMATYRSLFDMGVVDADWIAKTENLPKPKPKPKPEPVAPQAAPEPEPEPAAPAPPPPDVDQMREAHRALLMDAAARFIKVEAERARGRSKKGAPEFEAWLLAKRDEDCAMLSAALIPSLRVVMRHSRSCFDADVDAAAGVLAARHVDASREALLALPAKDLPDHVERLVAGWEIQRALELAERGLTQGGVR